MRKKFSKKTFIALFTSLTMLILACVFLAAYIIENNKYRTFTSEYKTHSDVYDERYYQVILEDTIDVTDLICKKNYPNDDSDKTYTLIGFTKKGQAFSDYFKTLNLENYNDSEHIITRIELDEDSVEANRLAGNITQVDAEFTNGMKQYIRAVIIPNTVVEITEQSLFGFGSLEYLSTPFIGTERGSSAFGLDIQANKDSKPFVSMFSKPAQEATFVGHDADENGNLLTTTYPNALAAWYEEDQPTEKKYLVPAKLSVLKITDETSLGNHALFNINSLITIDITANANIKSFTIGTYCFSECENLRNVVIPQKDVSFYGSGHFSHDKNLRNIELPNQITSIPAGMFKNNEELRNVIIPDTIMEINTQAFYGCSSLTYVIRKNNLREIISTYNGTNKITYEKEGYDFVINTNNKITNKLDLPSSLKKIANEAFVQCIQFTSIVVPNSVEYIGPNTFNQCGGLREISLPFVGAHRGTTEHNYNENPGCTNSKETCNLFGYIFGETHNDAYDIQVKQQVTYPSTDPNATDDEKNPSGGNYAIPKNLKTVYITDDTEIAVNAFQNYKFLETLIISDSVTKINEGALNGCGGLINITIPFMGITETGGQHFGTIFGTYVPASTTGTYLPATSNEYQVPESLNSIKITNQDTIYTGQLANLRGITTVEISDETNYIQESVFYDNPTLTTLYVPFIGSRRGVYYVRYRWWRDYQWHNSLQWIFSSTKHEDNTYVNDCMGDRYYHQYVKYIPKSLENVYITSDTAINSYGLQQFCSIKNLHIYSGRTNKNGDVFELRYMEQGCMSGCSSLVTLEVPYVGYDINSNTISHEKYTLGYFFGRHRFEDEYTENKQRTQYRIDVYITTYNRRFWEASYVIPSTLTGVTVTSANAKITESMFENFKYLTSINFTKADIQSLGDYAFASCTNLNTILYPNARYTEVGDYAFYKCINLHNINAIIPDTVDKIGNYSFAGSSVGDETNPIDLTRFDEIGNYAFYNCMKIKRINITNNITRLGEGVFQDCQYLTDVTLTKKIVTANLFKNCYSLKVIDIRGITSIPAGLFDGDYNLTYDTQFNDDIIDGLIIDKETTYIGKRAFANCSSLQRFDIFTNLDYIGEYAFYGCTGLEKMHMLKEVSTIMTHAWDGCDPNFYFTVDIATTDWPSGWSENWNCGYPVYAPSDLTDNLFEYVYDFNHKGYLIIGTKPGVTLTGIVKIPSTHDGLKVWGISNQGVKNNNGTPDNQSDDFFEYKISSQDGITAVVIPSTVYYIEEGTFVNGRRVDLYFTSTRTDVQNIYASNSYVDGKRLGWNTYADETKFILGGLVFYGDNWQYGTYTQNSLVPYVKVSNSSFKYGFMTTQYTTYEIKAYEVEDITLPGYVVINSDLGIDSDLIKLSSKTFKPDNVNLDDYTYAAFDPTLMFDYTYYNNIDAGQARVVASLNSKYYDYLKAQTEFGQNQILLVGSRTQYFTIQKASIDVYKLTTGNDNLTHISKPYDEQNWRNDSFEGLVDGLEAFNASFTGRLETTRDKAGVYIYDSEVSGAYANGNGNFSFDYHIYRNGRNITSNFNVYLYLEVVIEKRDVMIDWTDATYDTNNECYLTYYNGSTPAVPNGVAVDYLAYKEDSTLRKVVNHCEVKVNTAGVATLIPTASKYTAYAYLRDENNYRLVDNLGNPINDDPIIVDNAQKTRYVSTDFIISKGQIEIEIQARRIISPTETCWSYDFNLTKESAESLYNGRTTDNIFKITGIGTDTIFSGRLISNDDENTLYEWNGETNKIIWDPTYRENSSTIFKNYHLYRKTENGQSFTYTDESDYYEVTVKSISVIIDYEDMSKYIEYYVSYDDGTHENRISIEETGNTSSSGRNIVVANYNVNGNTFIIYVKVNSESGLTGIHTPVINYFHEDTVNPAASTPMTFKEPDRLYSVGVFIEGGSHHFIDYNRSVYLYTHKSPVTFMDEPLAKEYDRKQLDLLSDKIITDIAQEQIEYLEATPECLQFYNFNNATNALPNAPTEVGTYKFKLYLPETDYYLGVGESLEKPATYTISINKREIIIDLTGETTLFTDENFTQFKRKYNDERQRFTPDSDALIAQGYVLGEDTDLGFPKDEFKGYFETAGITPQVYEPADILSYWSVVNSETGIDVSKNYKVTFINSYEIEYLEFAVVEHDYIAGYDGSYHTVYVTVSPERPQDTYTIYYSNENMFVGEEKNINFKKAITTPFGRSTPMDEEVTYYYAVVGKNYTMKTGSLTIYIKYLEFDINDPAKVHDPAKDIVETDANDTDGILDDEMAYVADYNGEYQKFEVTVTDPWYAKVYYSLDQVHWTEEPYEVRECNDTNPLRIWYKVEADYYNTLYSKREGNSEIEPVLFYVTEKRYPALPEDYRSVNDKTVTYNGQEHEFDISVTPKNNESYIIHYSTDGVNWSIMPIKYTDAGVYEIYVRITVSGYRSEIFPNVKLTIEELKFTGISVENTTHFYDGQYHTVKINGLTLENGVYYYGTGENKIPVQVLSTRSEYVYAAKEGYVTLQKFKDVSVTPYKLWILIRADNYEDLELATNSGEGLVTITKATVEEIAFTYVEKELQYTGEDFDINDLGIVTTHDKKPIIKIYSATYDEIADKTYVDTDILVSNPTELGLYAFTLEYPDSSNCSALTKGANPDFLYFKIVQRIVDLEYQEVMTYTGVELTPIINVISHTKDEFGYNHDPINGTPDAMIEVGEYQYKITLTPENSNYKLNPDYETITIKVEKIHLDLNFPLYTKEYDGEIFTKTGNKTTWNGDVNLESLIPGHYFECTLTTQYHYKNDYYYSDSIYASNLVYIDWDIYIIGENNEHISVKDEFYTYEVSAHVKITNPTIDATKIKPTTVYYDGYPHSITIMDKLSALMAGATVKFRDGDSGQYVNNPVSKTVVGTYPIQFQISKSGWETYEGTTTLTILASDLAIMINDVSTENDYQIYDGTGKQITYTVAVKDGETTTQLNPDVYDNFITKPNSTQGEIRYYKTSSISLSELKSFYNSFDPTLSTTSSIYKKGETSMVDAGNYYAVVCYYEYSGRWNMSYAIKEVVIEQRPIQITFVEPVIIEKTYDKKPIAFGLADATINKANLIQGHDIDLTKKGTFSVRTYSANANSDNEGDGNYYYNYLNEFVFDHMKITNSNGKDVTSNYRPVLSDNVKVRINRAYLKASDFVVTGLERAYNGEVAAPNVKTPSDGELSYVFKDLNGNIYKDASGNPVDQKEVGSYLVTVSIATGTNYYGSSFTIGMPIQEVQVDIYAANINIDWENTELEFNGSLLAPTASIQTFEKDIVGYDITKELEVYFLDIDDEGKDVESYAKVAAGKYMAYARFSTDPSDAEETAFYNKNYSLINDHAYFIISPRSYNIVLGTEEDGHRIVDTTEGETEWITHVNTSNFENFPSTLSIKSKIESSEGVAQLRTTSGKPGVYNSTALFDTSDIMVFMGDEDVTESISFEVVGTVVLQSKAIYVTPHDVVLTYIPQGHYLSNLNLYTLENLPDNRVDVSYAVNGVVQGESNYVFTNVGVYNVEFVLIDNQGLFKGTTVDVVVEITQATSTLTFSEAINNFTYNGSPINVTVNSTSFNGGSYSTLEYEFYVVNDDGSTAFVGDKNNAPIDAGTYTVRVTNSADYDPEIVKNYTVLDEYKTFTIKPRKVTITQNIDEVLDQLVTSSVSYTSPTTTVKAANGLVGADELTYSLRSANDVNLALTEYRYTGLFYYENNRLPGMIDVPAQDKEFIITADNAYDYKFILRYQVKDMQEANYRTESDGITRADISQNYYIEYSLVLKIHYQYITGYTVSGGTYDYDGYNHHGTVSSNSPNVEITQKYSTNPSNLDNEIDNTTVFGSIDAAGLTFKEPGEHKIYYRFTATSGLYEPLQGSYIIKINKATRQNVTITSDNVKVYDGQPMFTKWITNCTYYIPQYTFTKSVVNGVTLDDDILNYWQGIDITYYLGETKIDPETGCINAGLYTYTLILPETTYYLETKITNAKFTISPRVINVNDKEAKYTTTYANGQIAYVNNISNNNESKYVVQFADGTDIPANMTITGIFQTTRGVAGTYLGSNGSGSSSLGLKWFSEPTVMIDNVNHTQNYTVSLANASITIDKASINYNIIANDDVYIATVTKENDAGMDHWIVETYYDGQTAYSINPRYHLQMITPVTYSSFRYSLTGADDSWETYNVSYSQLGKGEKTFYIRIEATNFNTLIAKVTIKVQGAQSSLNLKPGVGFGTIDSQGKDKYEYNGTEVGIFDVINDFVTNNTEISGASNYSFVFFTLNDNGEQEEQFSQHVFNTSKNLFDVEVNNIYGYQTPRNIGKYRVVITQSATTNFASAELEHDFEIVQSEVSAAWTDADYTYNGLSQYPTPSIDLYSSDADIPVKLIVKLYNIKDLNTEITSAIDAGTYRAVVTIDTEYISLTDAQKASLANYKIKQANSIIQYTIAKRDLKISLNASTNYTYDKKYRFYQTGSNIGDGFFSPQGIISDSENGIFHSVQGCLQTTDYVNKNYRIFGTDLVWINDYSNTGTTKIKILDQSSKSVEANYNVSYELNVMVDFTATETSVAPYNGTYDGKPHSITVTVNNTNPEDYIIEYSVNGTDFRTQNYEFTDVKADGTAYIVYYRAYKASDGDEGKANAKVYNSYVAITKKNAELSFVEPFPALEKGKIYDGIPVDDPLVECLDTTAKFTYKYYKNSVSQANFVGSNTYSQAEVNGKIVQQFESSSGIIPVSVGKYILVVELENNSNNYMTTSKELEFEITKRSVLLTFNSNKMYDQVAWSKSVVASDFDNLPIVSGHTFTGLLMTKSVNVGTYDAISQFYWSNGFSIKDAGNNDVSANYELLYQLNVEITKAPMSAKIVPYEGTWDGKEHSLAKIELIPTVVNGHEYPVPISYTIEYRDETTNDWTTEPITKSEVGYYPIAIKITANNYTDLYIVNTEEYKSYIKINGLKWTDPDFASNFQYEHPYQYTGTPYPTPEYINCPSSGEQTVAFYEYSYYVEHMNTTFSTDTYLNYEGSHESHKISAPVDVGEYVFVLKIASDGIYEPIVFIQVFTIDKKDVEVEWEDLTLEYTGYQLSPKASYYSVEALGSMKIAASLSSNAFQTLIGVYDNVIATTEDTNYNLLNNIETFEITRMIVDRPLIREDLTVEYHSKLVIIDTSDNIYNLNKDGRIKSIVNASGKVIYKYEYEEDANGNPIYSTAIAYKSTDGETFVETNAFPYTITIDSDENVGKHDIVVSLDKYQTIDGYDTNYMWDTESTADLVFTFEITTWKFPNSNSQLKYVYNDTHFYTGEEIKPELTISVVDSKTQEVLYPLVQNTDFEVAYDKNISVTKKDDRAEIKVTFLGNFEVDDATLYFDILATEPTMLTIKDGKKAQFINAKYDKVKGVTIYEDEKAIERTEPKQRTTFDSDYVDDGFYLGHVPEMKNGNYVLDYFANDKNKMLLFGKGVDYRNKNNALTEEGLKGNVGTGFTVVLYSDESHDIWIDYIQIIVYGDLDGNGAITPNDSLLVLDFGGSTKVAKTAATDSTPKNSIMDDIYYFAGMTARENKYFIAPKDSINILNNVTTGINANYKDSDND